MDHQFDFDWELEAARIAKVVQELADENKRNGLDEALRELCEQQEKALKEYLAEQEREDQERSKKALESST